MAAPGRFASSSDDEIAKILAEKDSVNTKRCTKAAVKCFLQYLTESNVDSVNFEDYKPEELAVWLTKFYADARKKNGEKYKLTALKSIRFGLARYFNSEHELDIVKNSRFKKANDVFMAMSVNLKREGLAHVDHTVPLEEDELKQIYTSVAVNPDTPVGLQQKVSIIPMETAEQEKENCPTTLAVSSNTCNNIQTQLNTIPQTMGQFTPYITGCVVNFYMK